MPCPGIEDSELPKLLRIRVKVFRVSKKRLIMPQCCKDHCRGGRNCAYRGRQRKNPFGIGNPEQQYRSERQTQNQGWREESHPEIPRIRYISVPLKDFSGEGFCSPWGGVR